MTVSALIEELQFVLGEGPCMDAYEQQRPVLEPDLGAASTTRWLAFTTPAVEAGVRAVFGFPLQLGAVRLGALNLYRDRPGRLTDDQHADALVMADVAARAVLLMQANAPPGALAAELEAGGTSSSSSIRPRAWCPSSSVSAWATPSSDCAPTPSPTTAGSPR